MTKSRIPLKKFVKEYSVRNKLNEDIPVYSVTNSQGFCTEYFSKEVASQDKTTYKIVPRGYFAYNPSRINVGSVDWQKYEDRVIVSPLYNVFSVSDEIDCQYLYYFFRSNIGRQMIKAKSSGSVRDNLKIEMLKEMTIPDISMREQQFCSSVLDKLQILIKLKCDEIKQMDELVKARFVEMFGNPLHPNKYLKLGKIAILERGRFSPRPRNDPKYFNGEYPFIQTGDISSSNHRLSEYKQTLNEQGIKVSKKFCVGTIVMAIVGATIGATAILEREVYAPDSVIGITPYNYNNVFLETLLQFWQPQLLANAPECARSNINLAILGEVPIIDVDVVLQNQFADFVNQVNKSKAVIEKSLKELETLQDSLMQKYFS